MFLVSPGTLEITLKNYSISRVLRQSDRCVIFGSVFEEALHFASILSVLLRVPILLGVERSRDAEADRQEE